VAHRIRFASRVWPAFVGALAPRAASPALGALAALGLLLAAPGGHAAPQVARAAVATENAVASREAMSELDAGGNAFDAVVRAALVSGIVSPSSSGLGGGGFALLWRAETHEPYVLDFRECAPAAVDAAAFEKRPFAPAERARATGVPGELAGLFQLQHDFGKRAWRDVVLPAARVAETGFPVSPHLGKVLTSAWAMGVGTTDPGISRVFFPGGKAAKAGALLKNPALGRTLRRLANEGKTPYYEGDIGRELVATANEKGGALTAADLAHYQPVRRTALHVTWEDYDVYTMPPPSAGGLLVAETLGTFSKTELARYTPGSGVYQHLLAESMRGALSDRLRFVGDPDFQKFDVAALIEPARLARRKAQLISSERTHTLPRFDDDEHGTHHLLVIDQAGNVASLTTTVNNAFGAKITAPTSGIVLNDELDDFTRQKDVVPFGLSESPNRPRPGARPVSSMTPTVVVKDGKVVFALGGSGGQLIATNVAQLLMTHLVFGLSPSELVALPRFQVPTSGPTLRLEAGAPRALIDDLTWRGEVVAEMPENPSAVQVIAVTEAGVSAAADPRKHGSALAR